MFSIDRVDIDQAFEEFMITQGQGVMDKSFREILFKTFIAGFSAGASLQYNKNK